MERIDITCDACGRDLTTSGNSINYRLALRSENIPSSGPVVTDMMVYPAIERDAHFCRVECLREWLNREMEGR